MHKKLSLIVGLLLAACSNAGPGECGDGLCRPGESESCSTCATDCGSCAGCGDGACAASLGESCTSCASDCGSCPDSCGNGTCDGAEGCSTCPSDCGACPTGCTASTCPSGCCDGDACVTGASPGACGSGGRTCMVCGSSLTCSAGACVVDPTSRWNIVLEHLHVEPTFYTGVAFDTIGGTPDPYVDIRVASDAATPALTPYAADTYEVDYDGAPTATMVRASDLLAYAAFRVWDDDSPPSASDDPVGGCLYNAEFPVPDAAFAGVTQTLDCPRDASTMNSGFTLSWHLEPF